MEPKYLIPESLMKAIHDYLLSQPMRNVEGLVSALRNAEREKTDDVSAAV
jgi:hypothetical protein